MCGMERTRGTGRLVPAMIALLAAALAGPLRGEAAEAIRTWTDDSGKHQVRATLLGEENGDE